MPMLDEPFSALDAFTRRDLQDHLFDLWADTQPTLILVTHVLTLLTSLDRSLDRSVPDRDATQGPGQALWW